MPTRFPLSNHTLNHTAHRNIIGRRDKRIWALAFSRSERAKAGTEF